MDTANVAVLQFYEAKELLDTARRLCQQAELVTRVLAAHVATLDREQGESAGSPRAQSISGILTSSVSPTKHTSGLLPPAPMPTQEDEDDSKQAG